MGRQLGSMLDVLALLAVVMALISGMILGSGVSAVARSLFVLWAALALILGLVAMTFQGRWEFVPSLLWLVGASVLFLGVVQWWPGLGRSMLGESSPHATISASPHATFQWVLWGGAALALAVTIVAVVRHLGRMTSVTTALAVTLALLGVIGTVQTMTSRHGIGGVLDPTDPRLPSFVADIYGVDSAVGLLAYRPWEGAEVIADTRLFLPKRPDLRLFGGLLDGRHWALAVAMILPLLTVAAIHSASMTNGESWRTHVESHRAGLLGILGFALTAAAVWFGDPIIVPLAIVLPLVLVVLVMGRVHRARAVRFAAGLMLVLVVSAGLRFAFQGIPDVSGRWQSWRAESASYVAMLQDGGWLGVGWGAVPELLYSYRAFPSTLENQGGSFLAWGAEVGFVGLALVAWGVGYVVLRMAWSYRSLADDDRLALAGSLGALLALLVASLLGPGFDVPVLLGIALFACGMLIRALAGRFRIEEGMEAA